jgi:phosphatidylglycerophosphate synthase
MTSTRYTLGDISRSLPPEKAREERYGEWAVALLYRPVANLLALPLLRLSIRASQITVTGLVLGLSLPFVAVRMTDDSFIAIGTIGVLIAILDCVDGTIARVTGTASTRGHYLDAMTDIVARACLYAAVGIMVDRQIDAPAWLHGFGLLYCLGAALLYFAVRLSRLFGERLDTRSKEQAALDRAGFIAKWVFPLFSGLDWLLPIAVLIAGFFDALGWIVLWLVFYSALDFLYTQATVLKRLS